MAVKSPIIRDEMYCGTIGPEHAKMILNIRDSKVIPEMKHMIFNFPLDLVNRSMNEKKSIRKIVKEEGIDYKQYIGELRDYQTVGAAFMYMSPRSIIADGVGLGKTAEIAGVVNYLYQQKKLKRFIMAVETSALGQTCYELTKFTGMRIIAMPSEAKPMQKVIDNTDWNDVQGIIIKHSALKSDTLFRWLARYAREDNTSGLYDTFILDESSVIKNDKTKTYKYTKHICDLADRVHFMNATTFDTSIMDIYYQIDMMDENLLPKKWRIEKEFCHHKSRNFWTSETDDNGGRKAVMHTGWKISSYKNQETFKKRLKLVYFGRAKSDVGLDRPNIYKVYEVVPTIDQQVALSKGYRYNEVLNSPANIPELKLTNCRENIPKLERLCQLVENEFADSKVMIYCFHIDAQKAIKEELEKIGRKCCILNGEDTSKDKDKNRLQMINDFNSGVYDVIITNIKKSLNLNGGDVCIFYSMSTTVSSMEQIRGRIDRNVDDRIKTFILLLYSGTNEYNFFTSTVKERAKASRELTIDAKTAIDYFVDAMEADKTES